MANINHEEVLRLAERHQDPTNAEDICNYINHQAVELTTLRTSLEALVVTMREEARRIERTGADMISAAIDLDADRIEHILAGEVHNLTQNSSGIKSALG